MSDFESLSTSLNKKSNIISGDDSVTFISNETPMSTSKKISDTVNSLSNGVCVTPIKTRLYPSKEVAVITVDKNKNKTMKIQAPTNELLCRFKDVKIIDDGKWIPFFNPQLLGVEDTTILRNGIIEISVTRFDPQDTRFFIFGNEYINIDLPIEVNLSYEDDETNTTGMIKGFIERTENEYYVAQIHSKTVEGISADKLGLPTFKLIIPV